MSQQRIKRVRCVPAPRVGGSFPTDLQQVLVRDLKTLDPRAVELWNLAKGSDNNCTASAILQCIGKQETVSSFAGAYLLGSIVRKYQFPGDAVERRANALRKFRLSEEQCSKFNRRGYHSFDSGWYADALSHMRWFVRRVLGDLLPTWENLTVASRHGPGAAVQTKGTCPYDKYVSKPYSVTAAALLHARHLITDDHRWYRAVMLDYLRSCSDHASEPCLVNHQPLWGEVFREVPGNRVTTVPKDAATDRPIAIEPAMNVMLQLGVDGFIRKRLKRWGIDMDCQAKNGLAAWQGSVTDQSTTLDLSSASDSVSLRLCKLLLPNPWFRYLCAIRSPKGSLPEHCTLRFSKISSMGNGYTFALETLIFTAICFAACKCQRIPFRSSNICVYGDDIIVPSELALRTVALLEAAGFTVNMEKSFFRGPFRESCGADWYRGEFVRPVFLQEPIASIPDLFVLHNRLRYWASQVYGNADALGDTLEFIRNRVPAGWRFVGPESDEDIGSYLHIADYPRSRPPKRNGPQGGYYRYKRLVWRMKTWELDPNLPWFGLLANPLHPEGEQAGHPIKGSIGILWKPRHLVGVALQLSGKRPTVYVRTRREAGTYVVSPGTRFAPGSYSPYKRLLETSLRR